jgi:hypothetical protein
LNVALPPSQANAGFARRLALDLAALWLERADRRDGVLLTTDADSRVPPQWLARNLAAIHAGCDAVAGRVTLEPAEEGLLPQALMRRTAREDAYEQALLALSARIDPIAHGSLAQSLERIGRELWRDVGRVSHDRRIAAPGQRRRPLAR